LIWASFTAQAAQAPPFTAGTEPAAGTDVACGPDAEVRGHDTADPVRPRSQSAETPKTVQT